MSIRYADTAFHSAETTMNDHALVKARTYEVRSPHNRIVTIVLCWFFGVLGVHRFYVGKWMSGLLMLLTGGGFGIWWIVDFIMILLGRFTDAEGRILGPPQVVYDQLPAPRTVKTKQLPAYEPELAPVKEPEFDDALLGDPLEEQFAELESELKRK